MNKIPLEICEKICDYLSPKDLYTFTSVNRCTNFYIHTRIDEKLYTSTMDKFYCELLRRQYVYFKDSNKNNTDIYTFIPEHFDQSEHSYGMNSNDSKSIYAPYVYIEDHHQSTYIDRLIQERNDIIESMKLKTRH